jgi:hypothetical protein
VTQAPAQGGEVDPTYGTNLARCLATAPVRLPPFLRSS